MKQEIVTPEQVSKIRSFYRACLLWMPDKSQWRSWKFLLPDGTYKRFHLKNEQEFRKLLLKFTPSRVYYSSLAMYNIRNFKGKSTKNQIVIFKDSIIDLDNPNFEECRKSAIEIIRRLGHASYILKTYKGIHLCYYKQRIDPKLIEDVKDFDKDTLKNEYNEFSCPLTLNKGKVCTLLTYEQLVDGNINQEKVYDYIPYDGTEESESPQGDEQCLEELSSERHNSRKSTLSSRSKINGEGSLSGSKDLPLRSFNNQVKPKVYIPVLIYNRWIRGLKKEVTRLVQQYDLGNLYVFENNDFICFISLKCMESRQLQKLLNNSRSITKLQFNKFGKIWFNFEEWNPSVIIRFTKQKYLRASKKHYIAFNKMGFQATNQPDDFVGKKELNVYNVGMK